MLSFDLDDRIEEVYSQILLSGYDNITVANSEGIFIKVKNMCKDYFGVSEDEFVGQNAFYLESKGVFDISATAEVMRRKREVSLIQRTKGDRLLLVKSYPIMNSNNDIVEIVNFSKDVTSPERLREILDLNNLLLKDYQTKKKKKHNELFAESENMKHLKEVINAVINLDTIVLLLGETGTGKSYIARYIHENSNRSDSPFVTVNCGAIPSNLMESELFGYERGSFTGGLKEGKKGLIEMAGNGTILMDEIGDMPLELQVKLLHLLDNREFTRIGSISRVEVKARFIFATNCDLKELVRLGKFRKDLYYRISVLPVEILPLRERHKDIPLFIDYFLKLYNEKYQKEVKITQDDIEDMCQNIYPGNIRELMNIIERKVILSQLSGNEQVVTPKDRENISNYVHVDGICPIKMAVEELEKQMLTMAKQKYRTTRGISKALQIDQSTVVKKMNRYFDE